MPEPFLPYVPKDRLESLMRDWGAEKISTNDMSLWCCNHYFPGAQTPDPSVARCQQDAIDVVLMAFEWQAHDDKVTARREGWHRAVEFLNCTQETYESRKAVFLKECAGH